MRPFFSYYGAKWLGAKHYGPPRQETVIEPFAGSACYSTYWSPQTVKLYDVSPDICDLWHFLIHCSEQDIQSIPSWFDHIDQVMELSRGPQLLVRFWVAKGRSQPTNVLSPWHRQYQEEVAQCRVWSPATKSRILQQKPFISGWSIDKLSWDRIPINGPAHWHVDPPYNSKTGRKYPFSSIDYNALACWCHALPGDADVCENEGSDWLPFSPLYEVTTSRGSRSGTKSSEFVWRKLASDCEVAA